MWLAPSILLAPNLQQNCPPSINVGRALLLKSSVGARSLPPLQNPQTGAGAAAQPLNSDAREAKDRGASISIKPEFHQEKNQRGQARGPKHPTAPARLQASFDIGRCRVPLGLPAAVHPALHRQAQSGLRNGDTECRQELFYWQAGATTQSRKKPKA